MVASMHDRQLLQGADRGGDFMLLCLSVKQSAPLTLTHYKGLGETLPNSAKGCIFLSVMFKAANDTFYNYEVIHHN